MVSDAILEAQAARAMQWRRQLHKIPETAFEEFQTAGMIRAELDRLGIAHIDGVPDAPTATIALIGDASKPCVALRSDIDALPILEKTGVAHQSTHPGRMHACGHDGHMATLAGTAAILKSVEKELPVCVKLIWQPAEEQGGGARHVVRAGALDGRMGPKPRAIFGLHGWPGIPLGTVATKPGPLLASTDTFKVTFLGSGCHGAYPHLGHDPIVSMCETVLNLQQVISRDLDPLEPGVVTVGIINGGTATNIIPQEASFEGTARSLSDSARKLIKASIARRCTAAAAAGGCTVNIDWQEGYPVTCNDAGMSQYVAATARDTLGQDRFLPVARPAMGGEDFAFYLQQLPGCFFLIGLEPPGGPASPILHSDRFDFNDAAIPVGMRMFLALVRNFPL
jgi:amidohydrolase